MPQIHSSKMPIWLTHVYNVVLFLFFQFRFIPHLSPDVMLWAMYFFVTKLYLKYEIKKECKILAFKLAIPTFKCHMIITKTENQPKICNIVYSNTTL